MSDAEKAAIKALREIVAMLDSVGDFTLSAATRFGETDDVVQVEFAQGWSTSCATRASVGDMVPRWRRDHPDAHFHELPKVTESPSLARRRVIADKRRRWLALYSDHAATVRRLLAEHDVDAGWRSSYSTTWRLEVPCSVDGLTDDRAMAQMMGDYLATIAPPGTVPSRSVECSGARDRFHVNTEQAGRVAAACYGQEIDGLEAALWCDYACSTCQADARRMVKALGAPWSGAIGRSSEKDAATLLTRSGRLRLQPLKILQALAEPADGWGEVERRADLNPGQNRKWSGPMQRKGWIDRQPEGPWYRTKQGTEVLQQELRNKRGT